VEGGGMNKAVTPNDLIKLTLANWIEGVARDPAITLEDFRFAQRLCSKVKNEDLGFTTRKLMKKSEAITIASLVDRGHLLDLKIESECEKYAHRRMMFRLVIGGCP
jgi:hypothetical protein